ncbi:hypothetical protein ACYX7E_16655 [Luteimonas sp. RIT-PG2_3]
MSLPLLALLLAAAMALYAGWLRLRSRKRQRAMSRLLDAADALETRLRGVRAELRAIGADPQPVQAAMQEMLRQRLWLQQHGPSASITELGTVETAIADASRRIDHTLNTLPLSRHSIP